MKYLDKNLVDKIIKQESGENAVFDSCYIVELAKDETRIPVFESVYEASVLSVATSDTVSAILQETEPFEEKRLFAVKRDPQISNINNTAENPEYHMFLAKKKLADEIAGISEYKSNGFVSSEVLSYSEIAKQKQLGEN